MRILIAMSIVLAFAGSANAGMYTALLNDESTSQFVGCTSSVGCSAKATACSARAPFLSKLFAPRSSCSAAAAPKAHGCTAAPRGPLFRPLGIFRQRTSCTAMPMATCSASSPKGNVPPPPIKKPTE